MKNTLLRLFLLTLLVNAVVSRAGVAYFDPPGGWTYLSDGVRAVVGPENSGFTSLDETWSHDNGSDSWDGSTIGGAFSTGGFGVGNGPGGVMAVSEGGVAYLRIQDTGDPRDYAFPDPSNRKIYFGHSMTDRGAGDTVLDDGITLTFRARIPAPSKTTAPLDPWHRDGQQAGGVLPYPESGDGYVTSDGGKGNFVIKQNSGGAIAFSLTQTSDTTGGALTPTANFAGLTMNEFAGNAVSGSVNFGQGTGTNVIAFDPTEWHEFWIVLRKDPANIGTHQAFIYRDGSLTPTVFKITAGTGSDYSGISYLAIGMTATPQNAALDIDFVGYKLGAVFPPGFAEPPDGWTYTYDGSRAVVGAENSGFASLDETWSHDNGSDSWDGSTIGGAFSTGGFGVGNGPGGVMAVNEGGVSYLRIQDTGDPRDYAYPDPSNRKIYFGHSMTDRGAGDTALDDGVTLSFRARVPAPSKTTAPLDPWHRDGQQAGGVLPYPAAGDGYVTSDGGKGNFVIKQNSGGAIAFSLTTAADTTGGALTPTANFSGLTMNEFAGNAVSGSVNFGQGTGTNVIAFDPTDWHTFWITIRRDPANIGTHQAFIYLDGSLEPTVFKITAGTGSDYSGITYLAMGMTATPQNAALDIDFVSYTIGAFFPGGALDNLPPEVVEIVPAKGAAFYDAAQGLSFKASTIGNNALAPSGFKLTLNGQDVSGALTITGDTQNRSVTYNGLLPNRTYTGQLIVSDVAKHSTTNDLDFDTFSATATTSIEAEDYNYDAGQFIDNPDVNVYFGQVGSHGIDYFDANAVIGAAADFLYRFSDTAATRNSPDGPRPQYAAIPTSEIAVALLQPGDWMNYTRTISPGNYVLYLRYSATADRQVRLDRITAGANTENQTKSFLGQFSLRRTGNLASYSYAVLADSSGNPITLSLSGVQTLRLTALDANNDLNLNFLLLAPASGPPAAPAVAISPTGSQTGVVPDAPIEVAIFDGPTPINPATVRLKIGGVEVTGATVTDTPLGVVLSYRPPQIFVPGSSISAEISYTSGAEVIVVPWTFTVQTMPIIPAAYRTAWGSGQDRGFNINIRKARNDAPGALFPNLLTRVEAHLKDQIIDPDTGSAFLNEAAGTGNDGKYTELASINYEQSASGAQGLQPDAPFPNLDPADHNNISMEATAYLELRAGLHELVVASDDGFQLTVGPSFASQPLLLGLFNDGRSFAATRMPFYVEAEGVYAFRLLYMEGNGGAGVEFYSTDRATGAPHLVNDPADPLAIVAYATRAAPVLEPTITIVGSSGGNVNFSFLSQAGVTYKLESTASLTKPITWSVSQTISGDGSTKAIQEPLASGNRFYRLTIQ